MARLQFTIARRLSPSIIVGLILMLAATSAWAAPFDITDQTTRPIAVDVEGSADPEIVGTSVGATFSGGATHRIVGEWASDGITGTITFTAAALEAQYSANVTSFTVVPGSTTSTFTIDIATGHGSWSTSAGFDFDGIPPAVDTLALGFSSSGGPYLPLGTPGTVAGYEEDSLAPLALLFCTDVFSAVSAPGGCGSSADGGNMTFNPNGFALIPAYPYIPASGLLNMTGNSFVSVSSAPEWSERGDVMLSEVVAVPALERWALTVLVGALAFLTVCVLRLRTIATA